MKNHPLKSPLVIPVNVEIHEYDLTTKVLPTATASDFLGLDVPVEVVDSITAIETDIASYWSQDNVSSFVPGITPIEAYPVCQAYAEQISASGESESITLSDIELEQLLVTAADIKSENADQVESCQPDEDTSAHADSTVQPETVQPKSIQPKLAPLQADPFEMDSFDSIQNVNLAKTTNQLRQQTEALPPEVNTAADTATMDQPEVSESVIDETEAGLLPVESSVASTAVSSVENAAGENLSKSLETEKTEPIVPEIPKLAARQVDTPHASESEPDKSGFETSATVVTQLTPTLLDGDFVQREFDPNQLFESVEKSLTDLQSINHYESQVDFAPAISENDLALEVPSSSAHESAAIAETIEPQPEPAAEKQLESPLPSEQHVIEESAAESEDSVSDFETS